MAEDNREAPEVCADCGKPRDDSGMHFEAPGTNWGAALHHFRAAQAEASPAHQPKPKWETACGWAIPPAAPSPAREREYWFPHGVQSGLPGEWRDKPIPSGKHGLDIMGGSSCRCLCGKSFRFGCVPAADFEEFNAHLRAEVRQQTISEVDTLYRSMSLGEFLTWLREQSQ